MCEMTSGKCLRIQRNSWLDSGYTFLVLRASGLGSCRKWPWSAMGAGWTRTGSGGAASCNGSVQELEIENQRVGSGWTSELCTCLLFALSGGLFRVVS